MGGREYAVAVYFVCNQLSFRLPYYRVTGQGRGLLPTQPCGGKELKLYVRKSLSYKGQRNPGEGVQCQLKNRVDTRRAMIRLLYLNSIQNTNSIGLLFKVSYKLCQFTHMNVHTVILYSASAIRA